MRASCPLAMDFVPDPGSHKETHLAIIEVNKCGHIFSDFKHLNNDLIVTSQNDRSINVLYFPSFIVHAHC